MLTNGIRELKILMNFKISIYIKIGSNNFNQIFLRLCTNIKELSLITIQKILNHVSRDLLVLDNINRLFSSVYIFYSFHVA